MVKRRQLAGLIALLLVIGCGVFGGLNMHPQQKVRASSPVQYVPAKKPFAMLPGKLQSRSVPANTISLYESTISAATMRSQGCSAAHRAPGLIVLDWGQPVYFGSGIYGTYDFGGHDDTDTAIFHAVANFAQGIWSCRTRTTNIALAIGESNYYSGYAIPLTNSAWYADGQQWGRMINTIQSFLTANHYNIIGVHGAGDLEVEWSSFTLTKSLVDGFNSVTSRLYFDFGDASPGHWSNYQLWYVAFGARDNVPLPEIYYAADAIYDWAALDLWACRYASGPIYFKGVMSEDVRGTNSANQAFSDLYNALAANSCTSRYLSGMIFSTRIYHV